MCPSVSTADTLRALVATAAPGELPALAGELARGLAEVLARTAAPVVPVASVSPRSDTDALLTVNEAARRLGVDRSWLYRHWKQLPGARKLGHRTLRFSAQSLAKWATAKNSVGEAARPPISGRLSPMPRPRRAAGPAT
jgi:excisionase family DNA binding protein